MKKILLSATVLLSVLTSVNAQTIQPCNTYGVREVYLKNVPGYAAKLNAAEAASKAEYEAFLKNQKIAKTASISPTYNFTVPVVFHVLHLGEAPGTGSNIDDQICADALAQVNRDYAMQGADINAIDPLFKPLYVNSHMQFMLAQKDPNGNCTNGVVHHYDPNTNWDQANLFNYKYSTNGVGQWHPSQYLNIYVVKNIIGSSMGIIVGYTHLPGTSPVDAADAIVYNYNFLGQNNILDARSLSHEIGHFFGLSHTFGSTNSPGFECGNDDIGDTPATTGFFSTCPKPASFLVAPSVTTPIDSSDITKVTFGAMTNTTSLNSLTGTMIRPLMTLVATTVTPTVDTLSVTAKGVAGGYSDFSGVYGNDFNSGTTNTITIKSLAKSIDNNNVAVYIDYNNNGSFVDAGETIFVSPTTLFGTQTYTTSTTIPNGSYGIFRMRVITSNAPITGPTFNPTSGEVEDYNFNIGTTPSPTTSPINVTMATCDTKRPNIENFMDYSSCPKMFTQMQTDKVRASAQSVIGLRNILVDTANLVFTGILNKAVVTNTNGTTSYVYSPTTITPCSPIADFASNKSITCQSQSITFNSTSYNSTPTSYSWVFEGGTPATSNAASQAVTYTYPGTYSVSLTVSNANGTSTKSVSSVVFAGWDSFNTLPYSEDFESGTWVPNGMTIRNQDYGTPTWELSNFGAGTSSKSMILPNANYSPQGFGGFIANVDAIETPQFDFSTTTNVAISFDYSFARKTGVTQDQFYFQYTTDCGGTWTNVTGSPSASLMATSGGTVDAPYMPWSNITPNPKWVTKSFSSALLAGVVGKRNVRFRFWFRNDVSNGKSQNLYIDNINITGVVGVHEFENSLGLSIYPNPTNSSSVVDFTSPTNSKVNISVYDVTGRIVEESIINTSAGTNSKYSVNSSNKLTAGIYFITLMIDNNKVTKKLIIN